ncbi:galactosyl transferase GMA12/MNN10 family-domain-containing protein [Sporodiniella umbellata]|nr:galactosyl transferase GMA12/MNN10 family-domain-containing protein [Sporodiniella umbellata]
MASSELPFTSNGRTEPSLFGGSRLSRRKRTIFLLLLVALFFVLLFSADLNRVQNAVSSTHQDDSLPEVAHRPLPEEEEEEEDILVNHPVEVTTKKKTPAATETPNAAKPTTVQPPNLIIETPERPKQQHYKYFIIVASDINHSSRRQLIRSSYFGFNDNLEPCMKRDKGVQYLFWLYGNLPKTKTAERRSYETEKMEWNDFIKVKTDTYNQDVLLKWAKDYLKKNTITFDFLIVQDTYSFTQLNYIQQTIDAEKGKLPLTTLATDLVWYSPKYTNTLVAGSSALEKMWEYQSDVSNQDTDSTLLSSFFEFTRAIDFEKKIGTKAEVARLSKYFSLPIFLGEQERFVTWNNYVEGIADMTVSVANVFQDSDFAALVKRLNLGTISVCKPLEKATIAVVSSSYIYPDSCMERAAPPAADNKREYALSHNYAFVARSTEFEQQSLRADKRRPVWGKVDVVQKVLPKYDWIFWMDMDAVIMNPEHTVQGILDTLRSQYPDGPRMFEENIDLVIAKPSRDKLINAGVFFMRNTEWSRQFLNEVQGFKKWYNLGSNYEQGAMWELIQLKKHKSHVLLLDQDDHTFNTFPSFYKSGDFVVHFAPDKCPGPAVLKGLEAAKKIEDGEKITSSDIQ